ncbi:hypothetical protein ERO13_D12G009550v2 [Gossypium hirsutum]|uniref:Uncharacterized protein n=1 Tax=Gossypium darwinii TaxID=34276 RepID=A0A5D2A5U2_GOSDA|nr:hypothetical protein ERO13_D12G009550v2 [Gossypium hirsutum]TYG39368.1 hypothetical protein ES288_D12G011100v1 [Gossypium darwinii]
MKQKLPAKSPPSAPDSLSSWHLSPTPPSQISGPTVSASASSFYRQLFSDPI